MLKLSVFTLLALWVISEIMLAFPHACEGQRIPWLEASNSTISCATLLDEKLVFPRNIASREDEIWLVDKGSNLFNNGLKKGAIYRYRKSKNGYRRTLIFDQLDDPNDIDIRLHSDGDAWVYFTTRNTVQRFNADAVDSHSTLETIIDRLPTYGWHKLVAIHLTQTALYLTVPSSTDHCEISGLPRLVHYPCGEESEGTALIRRYQFEGDQLEVRFEVIAQGLRDALAMQTNFDETKLVVADNGWDQIDLVDTKFQYASTPHDEINIVDTNTSTHFGWPYCFDTASITPPYRRFVGSCKDYQPPLLLLPAHSAPLAMIYFDEKLWVNLHGNNDGGGKTVSFKLSDTGLPLSAPDTQINWRGLGMPLGRPLGLAKTSQGELLVSDDWNHQLIKITLTKF